MHRVRFTDSARVAVYVEADVRLGRPAPACSNPNAAAFYDDGDPAEVELIAARVGGERGQDVLALLPDEVRGDLEQHAINAAQAELKREGGE